MKTVFHATPETAGKFLADAFWKRIEKNEPVLFLCTGGTTASIAVAVCNELLERCGNKKGCLKWLFTVSIADERFGPEGHPESNWSKLVELGLPLHQIATIPLLKGSLTDDDAFAAAVRHYNAFLTEAAEKRQAGKLHVATLLGVGADDQTAGILPGCPAINPEEGGRHDIVDLPWAAGYRSSIFTRMTISPAFFPMIDLAAVWIDKNEVPDAADRLEADLPPAGHPAQLLKQAAETVVFIT